MPRTLQERAQRQIDEIGKHGGARAYVIAQLHRDYALLLIVPRGAEEDAVINPRLLDGSAPRINDVIGRPDTDADWNRVLLPMLTYVRLEPESETTTG